MSNHQIKLDNRELMEVKGVSEVLNFSEEEISLATELGPLLITGDELNIQQLNLDNGELVVEGYIISFDYTEDSQSGGFFSNLFK
ncbi:MAG: sporulation protein YabP [Bacillota bacterium]